MSRESEPVPWGSQEVTRITHTQCIICEQMCGLRVESRDNQVLSIKPDERDPYSWRDFCIKGAKAGDIAAHPARICQPMRRVGDRYVPASYEDAVADIAARLKAIVAEHGPDAVGHYSGNPGGMTFSNASFLGALMDGLGTRNKFTLGSIDHNAPVVVNEHLYHAEYVGLLPDIDACDFLLLIGANPAISKMNWFGRVPDGWRRVLKRVATGAELVIVDPRRTESAVKATLHLAIRPEQDWALLLAMLKVILDEGMDRVGRPDLIENIEGLRALAGEASLADLAARCDIAEDVVRDLARRFAAANTAMVLVRTGPAQGRNGVLAEWLSHTLNVLTDRIDVAGGRFMPAWPFSIPAVARAMPAREKHNSRVRNLPPVDGGYSLAEMAGEIHTPGKGQIRAMVINAGNPVASAAQGVALDAALGDLDLLVAVDLFQRESHRHAHWLIPGLTFLERHEVNVFMAAFNDRPFLKATRPAIDPPPGAKPEWEFYVMLAKVLDIELFGGMIEPTPDALASVMLAIGGQVDLATIYAAEHGLLFGERTMGHLWQHLEAIGRRADLCPAPFADLLRARLAEPVERDDGATLPYQLISRRRHGNMNSWLSDTTASLSHDDGAAVVDIHPDDAARDGLREGDTVRVRSAVGSLDLVLRLSPALRPGVLMIEHGWGSRLYDPKTGGAIWDRGVRRNELVSNEDLDPLSGVPRLNGMPVAIERA